MEYVDLLDPLGRPLGKSKPKAEAHRDGDWHGAVHVWIINSKGQILIQRRSPAKENYPNLWDVSVAGHISAGEEPLEAAIREAQEEIGIALVSSECRLLFAIAERAVLNHGKYIDNEFHSIFLVEKDLDLADLKFSDGEVEEVRFVTFKELQNELTTDPSRFVPHQEEYRKVLEVLAGGPSLVNET